MRKTKAGGRPKKNAPAPKSKKLTDEEGEADEFADLFVSGLNANVLAAEERAKKKHSF